MNPTFRTILLRALACPMFLFAAVACYAVPAQLVAHSDTGWAGAGTTFDTATNIPRWHARYGDRFPGCSMVIVLGDVLMLRQDGHLARVDFDTAWRVTHDVSTANDGWVVGWCR